MTDQVRQSCGFLVGILLHRELGEELCGACAVKARMDGGPIALTKAERDMNRSILADAVHVTTRKPAPKIERGYRLPGV